MALGPIVTSDWLRTHHDGDDDLVICDVRAYLDGRSGREAYERGHIEGARFIDLDTVLAAPAGPVVGRHPLPDPEAFAAGLSLAGIGHGTSVVAYDDAGGMIAGRLVWMLRIHGQPAALLDGGIDGWPGELTTESPESIPVVHPPRPWPERSIVDADQVAAAIADGRLVIDSRGEARYRGEHEPIDPKAGHIPGAFNLPFEDNLVSGSFRPLEELKVRFQAAHVDDETIFYCGSGVSACHNLLAAEAAGFGLGKLYVGSWSGWASDDGRPTATL